MRFEPFAVTTPRHLSAAVLSRQLTLVEFSEPWVVNVKAPQFTWTYGDMCNRTIIICVGSHFGHMLFLPIVTSPRTCLHIRQPTQDVILAQRFDRPY